MESTPVSAHEGRGCSPNPTPQQKKENEHIAVLAGVQNCCCCRADAEGVPTSCCCCGADAEGAPPAAAMVLCLRFLWREIWLARCHVWQRQHQTLLGGLSGFQNPWLVVVVLLDNRHLRLILSLSWAAACIARSCQNWHPLRLCRLIWLLACQRPQSSQRITGLLRGFGCFGSAPAATRAQEKWGLCEGAPPVDRPFVEVGDACVGATGRFPCERRCGAAEGAPPAATLPALKRVRWGCHWGNLPLQVACTALLDYQIKKTLPPLLFALRVHCSVAWCSSGFQGCVCKRGCSPSCFLVWWPQG